MKDSILYIVLRVAIFVLRFLPLRAWLFLARRCGRLYYYIAGSKNRRAYANLKLAFGSNPGVNLKRIISQMYERFAQNLAEAVYLPLMEESYVKKHVKISDPALARELCGLNKSIIFLGSHAGSWELSNIACAIFFKEKRYAMLAQPQSRHKKLDEFLNRVREDKGCQVIRVTELKKLMEYLSGNHILGTVADHGGKDGIPIEFFGKLAMTPTGTVKLAKKMKSRIILAFMRRVKGPDHELLLKPYDLVSTGDEASDLRLNLTNINRIFQEWITQYPSEYLWFYRRWKYSPQKDVLVLSDGRPGHVKQSLSFVEIISSMDFEVRSSVVEVQYKTVLYNKLLSLAVLFLGPRASFACLPLCLKKENFEELASGSWDIVVSAGSSLAAVNLALAYENSAKAVTIMKPGILPWDRFSCVIMPEHDRPPNKKGILITAGSLNSVSPESISKDFQRLASVRGHLGGLEGVKQPKIGLLIGGDSKSYIFTAGMARLLCDQLKKALGEIDGYLLLTTSQRTPQAVIDVLKANFKDDPCCKLFIVATEDNPVGAVGGILYLSDVVLVSAESISMVSEAVSSGKATLVFEPECKVKNNNKVKRFLKFLINKNYIYITDVSNISKKLTWFIRSRPKHSFLNDKARISEALKRIL